MKKVQNCASKFKNTVVRTVKACTTHRIYPINQLLSSIATTDDHLLPIWQTGVNSLFKKALTHVLLIFDFLNLFWCTLCHHIQQGFCQSIPKFKRPPWRPWKTSSNQSKCHTNLYNHAELNYTIYIYVDYFSVQIWVILLSCMHRLWVALQILDMQLYRSSKSTSFFGR